MEERRTAQRVKTNLPAVWENAFTRHEGKISSLSGTGCFVLTGGEVKLGELLRLEISLGDDSPLVIWGEVSDEATEIGFSLLFTEFESDGEKRLARWLESSQE